MSGDQLPPNRPASGANMGMAALGYLIAGIGFWGFIGWLIDHWLETGGIAVAIGCIFGAACGIFLVIRRLGV